MPAEVQKTGAASHIRVSYCELIQHPNEYAGKKLVVRAAYSYGFEWQELFGMKCRDGPKTWLEFTELDRSSRSELSRGRKWMGTINGTFYGTFHTGGGWGDGGYRFELEVNSVRDVEQVSKSGAGSGNLSAREQEKACQGDEIIASAPQRKH